MLCVWRLLHGICYRSRSHSGVSKFHDWNPGLLYMWCYWYEATNPPITKKPAGYGLPTFHEHSLLNRYMLRSINPVTVKLMHPCHIRFNSVVYAIPVSIWHQANHQDHACLSAHIRTPPTEWCLFFRPQFEHVEVVQLKMWISLRIKYQTRY